MNEFDPDISALRLTDLEKTGLQVFRNYQTAFDEHAEKRFSEEVDAEPFDADELTSVLSLLAADDFRMVAVIACAFADELLKKMYGAALPSDVIGGRKNFLGPLGPVGTLSGRIQLAQVFGLLASEITIDLDRLRTARNKISHAWDSTGHLDLIHFGSVSEVFPIETLFDRRPDVFGGLPALNETGKFRVRVIWLIARLAYEAPLYHRAKTLRLKPAKALYGERAPKRLAVVSGLAAKASKNVLDVEDTKAG